MISTTHSYEVLKAVAQATEGERERHFGLLRTERSADGNVSVNLTTGRGARSVIEQGFEIR